MSDIVESPIRKIVTAGALADVAAAPGLPGAREAHPASERTAIKAVMWKFNA